MVHNLLPFDSIHSMADSMASKAIYSSCNSYINQNCGQTLECDVTIKPAAALHHFIPSNPVIVTVVI